MPGTGGYLRTNWRKTQLILDPKELAGLQQKGSYAGSLGLYPPYGDIITPLVIFSWSGVDMVDNTGVTINACSMISAAYGGSAVSMFPGGTSGVGFKILPVGIMSRRLAPSTAANASFGNIWFSICTSDDSGVCFGCRCPYATTISLASASYHIVVTGFIVSTPFS